MRAAVLGVLGVLLLSVATSACGGEGACGEHEYSASFERIGVLRSTDGGATWTALGDACFHALELVPVDPSPVADESGITLYFLDLHSLGQEGIPRQIYRSTSKDGVAWSAPEVVFGFGENITDPYVLRLADGSYRMYLMHPVEPADIISAWSSDGRSFTLEAGARTTAGAIPGAVLLPDGRVRLFVAGDPRGITSLISEDGLNFSAEEGVRIPAGGARTTDPHPIALDGGGYLMVYDVQPRPDTDYPDEPTRLNAIEIHLARSDDALTWTVDPTPIAFGSVPSVVETSDGTLFLFYVDASHGVAE
jgi:hypothetical protein